MDLIDATDSEDELPEGWEERVTTEGRVYYANHKEKSTQWEHPTTNKCKQLKGELPFGWKKKILEDGTILFADNINQTVTYTDPRLAFAKAKHRNKNLASHKMNQEYISVNSTAFEVIRDRDFTGYKAIVTGSTAGIGLEIVKALAYTGCHVIMACRNVKNGQEICEAISKDKPNLRIEVLELDLANLKSVKEFADKYKTKHITLHMLFLNAATFETEHQLTLDNLEMMFQVNFLAQFYLARLLLRTMIETPQSKLIITGCEAHSGGNLSKFDINANQLNISRANFNFLQAYCNSKLCTLLFANEMNRRLNNFKSTELVCKSCHPGNLLPTNHYIKWAPIRCLSIFTQKLSKSLPQAAATPIYLAACTDLNKDCFYYNNFHEAKGSLEANDSVLAYRLWEISENMLINRTSEFDEYLRNGDHFSSFTVSSSSTSTSPDLMSSNEFVGRESSNMEATTINLQVVN